MTIKTIVENNHRKYRTNANKTEKKKTTIKIIEIYQKPLGRCLI